MPRSSDSSFTSGARPDIINAMSAASAPAAAIMLAFMRSAIVAVLAPVSPCRPWASWRISQREALAGLRTALERGAQAAVAALGRTDGFLANPQVRIPLPDSLTRAEKLARRMGYAEQVDELVVAMNRAAEAAVPEARKLLVDAVKKMSAQDAKAILTGGDTAGTAYFRKTSDAALRVRFLPIVKDATAKVGVAQYYASSPARRRP